MNDHDSGVTDLLRSATDDLDTPTSRIVAGSIARGRVSRRRHLTGTTVAAAVVIGVIGAGVTVVPDLFAKDTPSGSVELRPAEGGPSAPEPSTPPEEEPGKDVGEVTVAETPRPGAPDLMVAAADIPAAVAELLGRPVGEALRVHPYPVEDGQYVRIVHFRVDGMLASVIIEPVAISDAADCRNVRVEGGDCAPLDNGRLASHWGPDTADQVTAHGVVVWSGDGYRVSVLSYNAAEGKDVTPVRPEPALTRAEMEKVAGSSIWFG